MKKITKKTGNYVLVNHGSKMIISEFTKENNPKGLTVIPQAGIELLTGNLNEIKEKFPDYKLSPILEIKINTPQFRKGKRRDKPNRRK